MVLPTAGARASFIACCSYLMSGSTANTVPGTQQNPCKHTWEALATIPIKGIFFFFVLSRPSRG